MTPMRVVDFHAHIFPDDVAAKAMPALEEEAGVKAFSDGTLSGLLSEMARAKVALAVTQPVATRPTQVRTINDWAASTASDSVLPFGGMHPDLDDFEPELDRMLALGLPGYKVHPEYQRFAPDEPRLAALWEATAKRGMIVLFHAGIDIGVPTLRGTPEAYANMLDAHPHLVAVLAHMGGFRMWDDVRRHLLGREVFFDTSYTLGHLPDEELRSLILDHGAERVVFGSDAPWTDLAAEVAGISGLGLSESQLGAVLSGNADRLLAARTGSLTPDAGQH